jgi:hypothetical protein
MFKLKQVLKDISTLFIMLRAYGDDIKKLQAEVALLKQAKKPAAKKPVVKKTTK